MKAARKGGANDPMLTEAATACSDTCFTEDNIDT